MSQLYFSITFETPESSKNLSKMCSSITQPPSMIILNKFIILISSDCKSPCLTFVICCIDRVYASAYNLFVFCLNCFFMSTLCLRVNVDSFEFLTYIKEV